MIRCKWCGRFIKNVRYVHDDFTDAIVAVYGWCKRCHKTVPAKWDSYEDVVGKS